MTFIVGMTGLTVASAASEAKSAASRVRLALCCLEARRPYRSTEKGEAVTEGVYGTFRLRRGP
jgi:hypothetical protein